MLPEQRRRIIQSEALLHGSVVTTDLSLKFGVSEMTIRRDLRVLEETGGLRCTHGGAVSVEKAGTSELRFTTKELLADHEKSIIARYAAENFVEDNDVILLDPGTTAAKMVEHLTKKKNLVAVTNGLYTLNSLSKLFPATTVMGTGGILRDSSFTFVGPTAERFFEGFFAKTYFLSTIGYSLEAGLTDPQLIDTQVKKAMLKAAKKVVVLIDSSKFGVESMSQVLPPFEFDVLVTDEGAPREALDAMRANGVEVHIAR